MNKNILFLVSSLTRGGPINQLYELISSEAFQDCRSTISIISLSSLDVNKSRALDFIKLGCHVESFNDDSYNFLKLSIKMVSYIKTNDIDVVVSQGIRSDVSLSLVLNKIKAKCYCILHNYIGPDYKLTYGGLLSRLMINFHLYALRRLNVISVSQSVADYVKQSYNLTSTPIKNGVRSVDYTPSAVEHPPVKLIYVGVVNKRKRVKELVECCNQLEQDNVALSIVGSCEISDLNKKDKYATYLGQRNDIPELLSQHHIFVSFSAFEGLPMAALEALAMGTPCILSDIPPHKEIIGISPNFGCICDINNPKSLSDAIKHCLTLNPLDIKRDFDLFLSSEVMASSYYGLLMK
ncbi:glycosyltransferase family 4 protein [Buttiauxella agrestis]